MLLKFIEYMRNAKRRNGHDLGCPCTECHDDRDALHREIGERIRNGDKPRTIIEILAEAKMETEN